MRFSLDGFPRGFGYLALASFCFAFGSGLYNSTAANFLVQDLSIQPGQMGALESIREVPGLAMVGVSAATSTVAEPILGAGSLVLAALGIAGLFFSFSIPTATLAVFVWSSGLHGFLPLGSSLTLSMAEVGSKGQRIGQIMAVSALGTLGAMGLVVLAASLLGFRAMFLVAGAVVLVGAFALFRLPSPLVHLLKPRLVIRRRYGLYYLLTFLDGCRRQIFVTFAVFTLVKVFGIDVQHIALMMLVSTVVNLYAGPRVGRWIDSIGERRILIIANASVICVFLGYALVRSVPALFVLYFIDNFLFTLSMALTTYLGRLSTPEDLTPSLSFGVTVNHLAAVAMPLGGGMLWQAYGYQVPFLLGAGVAVIALIATFQMRETLSNDMARAAA